VKHIPHLVVGGAWDEDTLQMSVMQWRHLNKVLRVSRGDRVTYTDGLGRFGTGRLGSQVIDRGEEEMIPRGVEVTVAAAPPANKDRQRYLVEKLAELGVARLRWLRTSQGSGRVATGAKQFAWVLAAVEQSRGAWLMETSDDLATWDDLEAPVVVCDASGDDGTPTARTVAIGPEGGWAEGEIPAGLALWSLGPNVLRVETAAVVAVARILSG
jgi:16S rRNA (uracil1498-N3)-methyltransferase